MDKEVLKVIKLAVNLEKKEIEYYKKAAEKTDDPDGKKVFNFLAQEEEDHLKALKEHLAVVEGRDAWVKDEKSFDKRVCRTIRRKHAKDIIPSKPKANAGDVDALKQAIEIEKKSIDFYNEAGCGAKDGKAMKVLHYLLESEKNHLKELEMQHAFLKSQGFWYDNEITLT